VLFNFEALQGMLANNDVLEAQFNLVNDGVVMINSEQSVTKLNKSAEILFNASSAQAVGKSITDILGPKNNHFLKTIAEVSSKSPFATMMRSQITVNTGAKDANQQTEQKVNVNLYVSKLMDA
jgi:transcriptional regulator with PAS, ATPase and Fis domain